MRLDGVSGSASLPLDGPTQQLGACRPEDLLGVRALANRALAEGDPRKLTAEWVSDLRLAANELRVLRRALHPGDEPAQSLCWRLARYASVIAAVIAAEPESGP